jgi:pyrimidine operon attenuation protein/uracil phosphoribosyltransferase
MNRMMNPSILNEKKRLIFDKDDIERAIDKISREIIESHEDMEDLVLLGIRTGGGYLAKRIGKRIEKEKRKALPIGIIDITLYRDDWTRMSQYPEVKSTDIPFSIENKEILLVDDVLFTGRTIRAALDAIMDLGRPKRVELAILIDRGHREFPIKADFVGIELPTSRHQSVNVYLMEDSPFDGVILEENKYP